MPAPDAKREQRFASGLSSSSRKDSMSTAIRITEHVTLEQLLTPRQFQIAGMVRDGHPNQDIAQLIGIAENSVKRQLTEAFDRAGCDNRVRLAVRYEREHPRTP
jgi:DNA-binding NarL/FixJ family response regulator